MAISVGEIILKIGQAKIQWHLFPDTVYIHNCTT